MQTLEPGTIVVSGKNTPAEAKFLILPSHMSMWCNALQISGKGVPPGSFFYRGGPLARGVFGDDFEIVKDEEFRMVARNGEIRCILMPLSKQ